MDKSFALVLPDRPGALREVMRIFASHAVSVQRVSYNRVVDVHAVFLDVWGTADALADGRPFLWVCLKSTDARAS